MFFKQRLSHIYFRLSRTFSQIHLSTENKPKKQILNGILRVGIFLHLRYYLMKKTLKNLPQSDTVSDTVTDTVSDCGNISPLFYPYNSFIFLVYPISDLFGAHEMGSKCLRFFA